MLITVEKNSMGHLELDPVSARVKRQLIRDVLPEGQRADEALMYIQEDYNVDEFVKSNVPRRHWSSLRNGWPVTIRVSDEFFGYV